MNGRRAVWVLVPVLAVCLVLQLGRTGRKWQASRLLEAVKRVTVQASQRGRISRRVLERNVAALRRAEELDPVEVALPIARGGQYLLLERPEAAVRAYEKARDLEPRGELYAQLGRAHLKLGDGAAAERAFRTAVVLDHNQMKNLHGYLNRGLGRRRESDEDRGAATGTAEGEIFSGDFESGDLRRWKTKQGGTGYDE
ncbi:MAG: hypothetical protein GY719_34105 [bacterium]|nr:hypothetical protein [bacterium]